MTALALMCLLADSPSLDSGNHAKNMSKALALSNLHPRKSDPTEPAQKLLAPHSHPSVMREAYLMSKDPALEKFVTPAVQSIIDGQNESGGWAYGYGKGQSPHRPVRNLLARSDLALGIPYWVALPEIDRAPKKATDYVSKCQAAKGTFAYKIGTGGKPSLTGAGAYCLMLTEKNLKKQALDEHEFARGQPSQILERSRPLCPLLQLPRLRLHGFFAGRTKGHTLWKKRSTQLILENQLPDGSWPVAVRSPWRFDSF